MYMNYAMAAYGIIKGGVMGAFNAVASYYGMSGLEIDAVDAVVAGVQAENHGGSFWQCARRSLESSLESDAIAFVEGQIEERVESSQTGAKFANGTDTSSEQVAFKDSGSSMNACDMDSKCRSAKASEAESDAENLMAKKGVYPWTPYHTELEAAQAIGPILHDVQRMDGVEIGAKIGKIGNSFFVGLPYSDGLSGEVSGVVNSFFVGELTAIIHSHPDTIGFSSKDWAYDLGAETGRSYEPANSKFQTATAGDLTSAYQMKINAYMVDDNGLHGWNYNSYVDMQIAASKVSVAQVKLGDNVTDYH